MRVHFQIGSGKSFSEMDMNAEGLVQHGGTPLPVEIATVRSTKVTLMRVFKHSWTETD